MDLNLLLIFDAVYAERSISKAAVRLNLSQPAVSNALGRLRETIGDQLFFREGNSMLPTTRAKSLRDPIRQALDLIERGFRTDQAFDFAQSNRRFVIAVGDYGEAVIIPRIIDWITEAAPGIHIHVRSAPSAQLKQELREGNVDFAMDYFTLEEPGFHNKCVLTDNLVSLSRVGHPGIGEQLSLATYLALSHVVIEPRHEMLPMIDLALAKRGLKRNIVLTVPHFLSMPVLVQSSNLICTLPRRMAFLYSDHFRLRSYELPLKTPNFPAYLIWHESVASDPGHIWLRNHLIALCQSL